MPSDQRDNIHERMQIILRNMEEQERNYQALDEELVGIAEEEKIGRPAWDNRDELIPLAHGERYVRGKTHDDYFYHILCQVEMNRIPHGYVWWKIDNILPEYVQRLRILSFEEWKVLNHRREYDFDTFEELLNSI